MEKTTAPDTMKILGLSYKTPIYKIVIDPNSHTIDDLIDLCSLGFDAYVDGDEPDKIHIYGNDDALAELIFQEISTNTSLFQGPEMYEYLMYAEHVKGDLSFVLIDAIKATKASVPYGVSLGDIIEYCQDHFELSSAELSELKKAVTED